MNYAFLLDIYYYNLKRIKDEENYKRNFQLMEVIKRQKESRNNANFKTFTEIEEIKKVNKTIEDMSIMGTIIKEQIEEEKITNPEKFVPIQEALNTNDKDSPLFVLGLLAQNLENQGVTTAIEKESSNNDEIMRILH